MNTFASFNSKIISSFFSFFLFSDFFIRNVIKFSREIDIEKTFRNKTRKKKKFRNEIREKKEFQNEIRKNKKIKIKFEKKKQYSNFYD